VVKEEVIQKSCEIRKREIVLLTCPFRSPFLLPNLRCVFGY
jgi:hypothetical protein